MPSGEASGSGPSQSNVLRVLRVKVVFLPLTSGTKIRFLLAAYFRQLFTDNTAQASLSQFRLPERLALPVAEWGSGADPPAIR